MAFDAKQAVIDKITHLEDDLKNLKAQRDAATNDLDTQISSKQDELDGWQSLLGSDKEPTSQAGDKPAAKKAASKR